jgi:hypothetical protein
MHVLLPVLRNALRTLGDAPCRSVEALRQHLGGTGTILPSVLATSEAVQAPMSTVPPPFLS